MLYLQFDKTRDLGVHQVGSSSINASIFCGQFDSLALTGGFDASGQVGLFGLSEHLKPLSAHGYPLEARPK